MSVTASTCSEAPFPFSNERKSMANSFIGSLAKIGTMGALGGSGDFLLMHLSQLAICVSTSFFIPGQQNRRRMRSRILSRPRWPTSLWQRCLSESCRTNWSFALSSTIRLLHITPSCSTKSLLSGNVQTISGLSGLSWSSDWFQSRSSRTRRMTGSFCWRLGQSIGGLPLELNRLTKCCAPSERTC